MVVALAVLSVGLIGVLSLCLLAAREANGARRVGAAAVAATRSLDRARTMGTVPDSATERVVEGRMDYDVRLVRPDSLPGDRFEVTVTGPDTAWILRLDEASAVP